MGQRLVVKILKDNKMFATVYFHWSGYTRSTYNECRKIINILEGNETNSTSLDTSNMTKLNFINRTTKRTEEDLHERLIRGMEDLGGGADIEDVDYIENTLGIKCKKENVSRNEGLVQFSEAQMEDALGWAEALATIDLDERTVDVNAFCLFDEEYDSEYYKEEDFAEVPDDMSLTRMKFEELENVIDFLNNTDACGVKQQGEKLIFIE